MGKFSVTAKKVWHFIWNDNSIWSWLINAVLAFIIIKFLVYPGLGLVLQTNHPVVAVISDSMQHTSDFDSWWDSMSSVYANFNITKDEFRRFEMSNGFSKGDLIILHGKKPDKIDAGTIIVFDRQIPGQPEPVIHRVVKKTMIEGTYYFSTKGDKNFNQLAEEKQINQNRILGTAWIKIPYVGYVKILFSELVNKLRPA
jgi:hypothetical protein